MRDTYDQYSEDRHEDRWRTLAACKDRPDAMTLFFPHGDPTNPTPDPDYEANTLKAKHICHNCPVRFECLQWAVFKNQPYGIWGGLTAKERKPLVNPKANIRDDIHHSQHGTVATFSRRCRCVDCVIAKADHEFSEATKTGHQSTLLTPETTPTPNRSAT